MGGISETRIKRLQAVNSASLTGYREFDDWGVNASSLASYEASFNRLLNGAHLLELIQRCPLPHLIVDLFSYGYATHDLPGISSISVALSDSPISKSESFKHVVGDLEEASVWIKLEDTLHSINPMSKKATAVLSRPLRGDEGTLNTLESTNKLITRVYKLLDYDGFAFIQVPPLGPGIYREWIDKLRDRGMEAAYQQNDPVTHLRDAIYFKNRFEFETLPLI